jgi:hypothetical protein
MATILICGTTLAPLIAVADAATDNAALQQATASCKTEVKEYAKYHETSWWQRHKMVKKCVDDALTKK